MQVNRAVGTGCCWGWEDVVADVGAEAAVMGVDPATEEGVDPAGAGVA